MRLVCLGLVAAAVLAAGAGAARAQSLGLGLRASSVRYEESQHSDGLGALARLRFDHLELELEVAHEPHAGSDRADTRFGGGLIVPVALVGLRPYVVAAAGVNRVSAPGMATVNQLFLAGGGGLSLDLIPHRLALGVDVRYTLRRARGETFAPEIKKEEAIEGRVTGVVYF